MGRRREPLTEAHLKQLIQNGLPVRGESDGDGLTFSVSPAGAKRGVGTWALRYRYANRPRWLKLGSYPDLSLKEARIRASKARVTVSDGIDPSAERRRKKMALANAKTFSDLAEDFMLRTGKSLKVESRNEIRRYLDKDLLPRLGKLRIDEITGDDIVHVVERIGKRSTYVAYRALEILNQVYKHAMGKRLAKANPCAGLVASAIVGRKELVREGVSLDEEQIRALFKALPAVGRTTELALRILLGTGARKGELSHARWENVDLERGLWVIPAENSKNGKAFTVPLVPLVLGWFQELKAMAVGSPYVLPGRDGRTPMSRTTLNAAIGRLSDDIPRFSPHDLRRTCRTHLGKLGVDVIIAEKCLNHTLGGLIDAYDRGNYLEQRRAALELWAAFLTCCEEGRPWVPPEKISDRPIGFPESGAANGDTFTAHSV